MISKPAAIEFFPATSIVASTRQRAPAPKPRAPTIFDTI
jgi:hypothetical protein